MSDHKESGTREVGMVTSTVKLCLNHTGGVVSGYLVRCFNCGEPHLPTTIETIPWDEVPTLELQEVQVNPKNT